MARGSTARTRPQPERLSLFALLGVLAILAQACGGPATDTAAGGEGGSATNAGTPTESQATEQLTEESVERVSLTLITGTTTPDPQVAEVFVAQDLGYFEEAGLDFDMEIADGALVTMANLIAGAGDVTWQQSEALPELILNGEDVVVVYISQYYPGYVFIFGRDSEVQALEDMEGRTLGVLTPTSNSNIFGRAWVEQAGVDASTVEFAPIGFGAEAAAAVETGRVDAAVYWAAWIPLLEDAGFEFETVAPEFETPYPSQVVVTTRSNLERNREGIVRFLQVLTRTRKLCLEDLGTCADAFLRESGDILTREQVIEQLEGRNVRAQLPPEANGVHGYMEASYFETQLDMMIDSRWIEERPEATAMFTDELLEEANQPPPVASD